MMMKCLSGESFVSCVLSNNVVILGTKSVTGNHMSVFFGPYTRREKYSSFHVVCCDPLVCKCKIFEMLSHVVVTLMF